MIKITYSIKSHLHTSRKKESTLTIQVYKKWQISLFTEITGISNPFQQNCVMVIFFFFFFFGFLFVSCRYLQSLQPSWLIIIIQLKRKISCFYLDGVEHTFTFFLFKFAPCHNFDIQQLFVLWHNDRVVWWRINARYQTC